MFVYHCLGVTAPTNSATVGFQTLLRNDGLTVVFNAPYVHDSLAVEISTLPRWMSVTPTSGSIPAGGSMELALQLDASGLRDGDYNGAVAIRSNDPDEPVVSVPCDLHVGVVSAGLDLDPNALNRSSHG